MDEQAFFRQIDAGELSAKIVSHARELLRYEIIYPRIKAQTAAERRINRYYQASAATFERLIKSKYLPEARTQFKALAPEEAFLPLEISAGFQVMLNTENLLSVFTDTYTQLRHAGQKIGRGSKTFDMQSAQPIRLSRLFERLPEARQTLLSALEPQIALEDARNPGTYFMNWKEIFPKSIREDGYYLTDEGIVIYFQSEIIAAANAGLPSFLVPYQAFGHVLNKKVFK